MRSSNSPDASQKLVEEEAKLAKASATYGKPKIGGPFSLIDQNGVLTTNNDFKGRYMLIYFGFTNCPDICPEELDKMAEVLDTVSTYFDSRSVAAILNQHD